MTRRKNREQRRSVLAAEAPRAEHAAKRAALVMVEAAETTVRLQARYDDLRRRYLELECLAIRMSRAAGPEVYVVCESNGQPVQKAASRALIFCHASRDLAETWTVKPAGEIVRKARITFTEEVEALVEGGRKEREEPHGWSVKTPSGNTEYDHVIFGNEESAEQAAKDFAEQDEAESWDIVPLFPGAPTRILMKGDSDDEAAVEHGGVREDACASGGSDPDGTAPEEAEAIPRSAD